MRVSFLFFHLTMIRSIRADLSFRYPCILHHYIWCVGILAWSKRSTWRGQMLLFQLALEQYPGEFLLILAEMFNLCIIISRLDHWKHFINFLSNFLELLWTIFMCLFLTGYIYVFHSIDWFFSYNQQYHNFFIILSQVFKTKRFFFSFFFWQDFATVFQWGEPVKLGKRSHLLLVDKFN